MFLLLNLLNICIFLSSIYLRSSKQINKPIEKPRPLLQMTHYSGPLHVFNAWCRHGVIKYFPDDDTYPWTESFCFDCKVSACLPCLWHYGEKAICFSWLMSHQEYVHNCGWASVRIKLSFVVTPPVAVIRYKNIHVYVYGCIYKSRWLWSYV